MPDLIKKSPDTYDFLGQDLTKCKKYSIALSNLKKVITLNLEEKDYTRKDVMCILNSVLCHIDLIVEEKLKGVDNA